MKHFDCIVVGAGIIGLLTTYELAKSGVTVLLLDKGELGSEASWAGGGIVSPLYPWTYEDSITNLVTWAQRYYPELCQDLHQATGIDPEYSPCGLYMLDAPAHGDALHWAQRVGAPLHACSVSQVRDRITELGAGFERALSMPNVGNVRNPRLLKALRAWLQAHPKVTLAVNEPVQALHYAPMTNHSDEYRIQGVSTARHRYHANGVLVACGAWTSLLLKPLQIAQDVVPVRGEMLVYKPLPNLLPSIVLHNGKYLIPRVDGRIVVGSTLDVDGYNKVITVPGAWSLRDAAEKMLPILKTASVEKHWSGLRPGSPGGIPYMGEVVTDALTVRGLFVGAGHYRNGLVTAPASARLLSDLMLNRQSVIDAEPFALNREPIKSRLH